MGKQRGEIFGICDIEIGGFLISDSTVGRLLRLLSIRIRLFPQQLKGIGGSDNFLISDSINLSRPKVT